MQTIYLDISNKGVIQTIYAKQGDVGRKFEVILNDSGLPYVPTSGSAFSVWYSGTSGEGNYTDIGDKSAFFVNGNKVAVEMISQMLLNDGDGVLSLALNDLNGNQISTWNIPYVCESVPGANSEEAKSYYTAFSKSVEGITHSVLTATDPNNDGNIVLQYGGDVVPGGGGSGGSGGSGIHIGAEPPTDENVEVWIDTDEEAPEEPETEVNADWNAAEGEPGHVLNRTHYVNGTKPKILLDKTFTISNNQWMGLGTIPLVVGKTYTAIWDGTEYECEVFTATYMEMDVICIGNPMLLQAGENNNIPFLFGCVYAQNASAVAAMVDGNYTLKITEEVTAYKPLEEGALPSIVLPKVIKLPADSLGGSLEDGIKITDLSYDELAEHLWFGGDVIIDISEMSPKVQGLVVASYSRRKVIDWEFGWYTDGSETMGKLTLYIFWEWTIGDDGKPSGKYCSIEFTNGTWAPPLT